MASLALLPNSCIAPELAGTMYTLKNSATVRMATAGRIVFELTREVALSQDADGSFQTSCILAVCLSFLSTAPWSSQAYSRLSVC